MPVSFRALLIQAAAESPESTDCVCRLKKWRSALATTSTKVLPESRLALSGEDWVTLMCWVLQAPKRQAGDTVIVSALSPDASTLVPLDGVLVDGDLA
jgi:hypothetical protein